MKTTRIDRLALCAITIAAGLSLRQFGYQLGLPFVVVKYSGSVLWGAMVFLLFGIVLAERRRATIAAVALTIAIAVELFRLWHAPALDAFRATATGALQLGRVFSLWNILAYACGIALAAAIDKGFGRPRA
jgi:hypothetical protein